MYVRVYVYQKKELASISIVENKPHAVETVSVYIYT
jgi:hypothetical protein